MPTETWLYNFLLLNLPNKFIYVVSYHPPKLYLQIYSKSFLQGKIVQCVCASLCKWCSRKGQTFCVSLRRLMSISTHCLSTIRWRCLYVCLLGSVRRGAVSVYCVQTSDLCNLHVWNKCFHNMKEIVHFW